MKILYKIYTFVVAWPLMIFFTSTIGTLAAIGALFGDNSFSGYFLPHIWAKISCALFLTKVEVIGRDNIKKDQSYVFLANHQGYFDIFLVYGYLGHNFKWMMKEYLKKMPFIGMSCMATHQIFVGDSLSSISKAVEQARKTLQGGMSMVIFPEGTRSQNGDMLPFKRGAFMLANEIGLPIVPLSISGSYDIFSRHAKTVSKGKLTLVIHEPISEEERAGKQTKILMQEVHDIIEKGIIK